MPAQHTRQDLRKWAGVIFAPEDDSVPGEIRIDDIASGLYNSLCKQSEKINPSLPLGGKWEDQSPGDKSYWVKYASDIPDKLVLLNLFIRPFKDFCRTCIITDNEIEKLARRDHDLLFNELKHHGWQKGKILNIKKRENPALSSFSRLPANVRRFFMELNYTFPVELKKAGFEIIRAEEISEIDEKMVGKIARAIHSRYIYEISGKNKKGAMSLSAFYSPGKNDTLNICAFDDLPEEIKYSNTDNAYHIPTKLLSIGYKIRPAGKGFRPAALPLDAKEVETMSIVEHMRWSWDKRLNGWTYDKRRDNNKKKHPGLLPYEFLTESEKDKDRELVRMIPSLLKDIGYVAYPVNPGRIKNLSYAIKPQSSIHRILQETAMINSQIRGMVKLTPELDKIIESRNLKIEEAIKEVEESYNYARHIQETFLPDSLFVRECFPESFILFKPKDILSGDFYFFSKKENLLVFAAADCTGHGIPGAILTTIGYQIIDHAINEINLTDPSSILEYLYSRIHRFLRSGEGSGVKDDLDIVLCAFDMKTNLLSYSSVTSPFYRISDGQLSEYTSNSFSEDSGNKDESIFAISVIELGRGDKLYLFSDGFKDQFGGSDHKKYQTSRFKSFLQKIHKKPMAEQGDLLFEEIEKWREEKGEDQTDDIMVIGISI